MVGALVLEGLSLLWSAGQIMPPPAGQGQERRAACRCESLRPGCSGAGRTPARGASLVPQSVTALGHRHLRRRHGVDLQHDLPVAHPRVDCSVFPPLCCQMREDLSVRLRPLLSWRYSSISAVRASAVGVLPGTYFASERRPSMCGGPSTAARTRRRSRKIRRPRCCHPPVHRRRVPLLRRALGHSFPS